MIWRFRYTKDSYEDCQTEEKLKELMNLHNWFLITKIDDDEKDSTSKTTE